MELAFWMLIYVSFFSLLTGFLMAIDSGKIKAYFKLVFFGGVIYPVVVIVDLDEKAKSWNMKKRLDIAPYKSNYNKLTDEFGKFYEVKLFFVKKERIDKLNLILESDRQKERRKKEDNKW